MRAVKLCSNKIVYSDHKNDHSNSSITKGDVHSTYGYMNAEQ